MLKLRMAGMRRLRQLARLTQRLFAAVPKVKASAQPACESVQIAGLSSCSGIGILMAIILPAGLLNGITDSVKRRPLNALDVFRTLSAAAISR